MSGSETSVSKTALVLQGGGARGAYHVGVIKALAEITGQRQSPFQIVCGASVGAINAAALAVSTHDFQAGAKHLEALWRGLDTSAIFDTRALPLLGTAMRWAMTPVAARFGFATTGGLLDYAPLRALLQREFNQDHLRHAIKSGALHALSITASSYRQGDAVTFYEGHDAISDWNRARRRGERVVLTPDHVLASAALPFAFAPVRLSDSYFGDGSLRLTSPLSPAIHLGADRILVISTRDDTPGPARGGDGQQSPSIGEIAGHALDILFNDSLEADHERLTRINQTVSLLDAKAQQSNGLRPIDTVLLRPSLDVRNVAQDNAGYLPWSLKVLMRSIGILNGDGRIASYLMFEPDYISALIDMGHADTLARSDEIAAFLQAG